MLAHYPLGDRFRAKRASLEMERMRKYYRVEDASENIFKRDMLLSSVIGLARLWSLPLHSIHATAVCGERVLMHEQLTLCRLFNLT